MRTLALILARGGSKRVPGKNARALGGVPLISWSIATARRVAEIGEVLVSTDDPAIAAIARAAGALVPWLRPAELASDTASSAEAAIHALNWYEREKGLVDALVLLQPTSPFRSTCTIRRGLEAHRAEPGRSVVAMSPARSHPMWCYRIEAGHAVPFLDGAAGRRSQDLPPAYVINGAFYLTTPAQLRATGTFVLADFIPLIVDDLIEGVDIDSEFDWAFAESLVERHMARHVC